ncbi:pyridoxamine 5'-phosphate oxidase [Candidatus Binatia bacterium]|jgi:pyridoxamine 5'-phosphate oxidase|nr:pyridoxamine 5'-phosphate oxidase [Candidatus Binatia bacterium]
MPADPILRFRRWLRDAEHAGAPLAEAMSLATATRDGVPSLRMVLLKQADADGFVFYTDARSRKGRELRANPRAAATFHWNTMGRQVRVEGRVVELPPADADAYWVSRPRGSQLSGATSHQSRVLASRAELVARRAATERRFAGSDVPRPPEWRGFRIVPASIEFWTHKDDRLHHRERFTRRGGIWQATLLEP